MEHSNTIKELAGALAKAQAEVQHAHKNAENPHFRSTFADLTEIIDTVRPVLAKYGLAIVQIPGFDDGVVTVETVLTHESGEWLSGLSGAPATKMDPQGVGSAVTYLRRYALAAMCGIGQVDDDGHAASGARQGAASQPTANGNGHGKPAAKRTATTADPTCPKCDGPMWNNLEKKASGAMKENAPDYKCKDKACADAGGLYWPGDWPGESPEPPMDEKLPPAGAQPALAADAQVVKIAQLRKSIEGLGGDASVLDPIIEESKARTLTAVRAANAIAKAEKWIAEKNAVGAAAGTDDDLPF